MDLIGNRYEVLAELGQGGMGTIFKGNDTQTNRIVAIKLLKPEVVKNNPDMLQRFAQEGEALRKLNHPNIVKVFATIEDRDNHYIIMDFVEGGSLRDLLNEQPQLSISQILNIALDLSDALIRAHRLKIIHRDIKPENVLLNKDGLPLLSDFGVARMNETSGITKTGAIIGTLSYLPPEVFEALSPDERVDMWGFGVMLYEMLTGRRPFEGETTAATVQNILMKPVPNLLALRSDVPWTLAGLVYWMLEKAPDKRPASMRLVGALLENILSGAPLPEMSFGEYLEPTQAVQAIREYTSTALKLADLGTPPTPSEVTITPMDGKTLNITPPITSPNATPSRTRRRFYPSSRTVNRPQNNNPRPAIGRLILPIVGLIAILGILAVIALEIFDNPPEATVEPVVIASVADNETMLLIGEFARISGEERDANRLIVDDLRQIFEDLPLSRVRIREYPKVIENEAQALELAKTYHADVVVWGTYDDNGADVNIQAGDISQYQIPFDDKTVRQLTDIRTRVTLSERETLAFGVVQTENILASYSGRVMTLARNLATLAEVSQTPAPVQGRSINAIFYEYLTLYANDTANGVVLLDEAIRLAPNNPMLFAARALGYQRLGDVDRAIEDNITSQSLGPNNWIAPYFNLFNIQFYLQADFEASLITTQKLIEIAPDNWFSYFGSGITYYALGRYEDAFISFEESLAKGADENFPYLLLVAIALRQGDFVVARERLNELLTLFPDVYVTQRVLSSTLSDQAAQTFVVPLTSAFGGVILRQWRDVIRVTDQAIADGYNSSDLYLVRGLAQCNLDDNAGAEESYTLALEIEPTYYLIYLLRAEVRNNQNNTLGATADLGIALSSPQAEFFKPVLEQTNTAGQLGCKTFLDFQPSEAPAVSNGA